jgi:hypothetical protein
MQLMLESIVYLTFLEGVRSCRRPRDVMLSERDINAEYAEKFKVGYMNI